MSLIPPCLVLAGGLGTRLRSVMGNETPKVLAPVDGQPFLSWLLRWLAQQGVTDVVLSVGHGRARIKNLFREQCFGMSLTFVEEDEPLGTGGAIIHALEGCNTCGAPKLVVMNGDTMSNLDLRGMVEFSKSTASDLVVAGACVQDSSRYGALSFDLTSRRLWSFDEKNATKSGYINAGVYVIDPARLLRFPTPRRFSFEMDFLNVQIERLDIRVFPEVTEFIDIGIPLDYVRAQKVVPRLLAEHLR
jgi:D-glycero-alpha-D-manno-heptose 1-phosphate guanylyltransferase